MARAEFRSARGSMVVLVIGMAWGLHADRARAGTLRDGEPERPWTLLVYAAVDNSADDPLVGFMNKVRRAIDDDPGIEVLLFIDRAEKHSKRSNYLGDEFTGARLYRLTSKSAERLAGGAEFPEITLDKDVELDSADATNVGRFIAWGKARAPAKRYALLVYSHANGATMCPDDQSKGEMGIAELTEEVGAAGRVDFLALELCQMGGIEIGYQWRPGNGGFEADVLLAIPNAGPPLDWDRAFARVRSPGHECKVGKPVDPASMTAADFGRLVIEEGRAGRQASEDAKGQPSAESAACYDLRAAGEVKGAVDALAVALARTESKSVVMELREPGPRGPIHYSGDGSYVDLYDLCKRISKCDRLSEEPREAARRVMGAVQRFMIGSFGMSAYRGFEAGKDGAFIVLPSGEPGDFKRFAWYTPLAGTGKHYGRWSFLRDGATPGNGVVENWFELLDSWFDETGDKGGVNGYRW